MAPSPSATGRVLAASGCGLGAFDYFSLAGARLQVQNLMLNLGGDLLYVKPV